MAVLNDMLPPDMLKYCQDHHLLESMIDNGAVPSPPVDAPTIGEYAPE